MIRTCSFGAEHYVQSLPQYSTAYVFHMCPLHINDWIDESQTKNYELSNYLKNILLDSSAIYVKRNTKTAGKLRHLLSLY